MDVRGSKRKEDRGINISTEGGREERRERERERERERRLNIFP